MKIIVLKDKGLEARTALCTSAVASAAMPSSLPMGLAVRWLRP